MPCSRYLFLTLPLFWFPQNKQTKQKQKSKTEKSRKLVECIYHHLKLKNALIHNNSSWPWSILKAKKEEIFDIPFLLLLFIVMSANRLIFFIHPIPFHFVQLKHIPVRVIQFLYSSNSWNVLDFPHWSIWVSLSLCTWGQEQFLLICNHDLHT